MTKHATEGGMKQRAERMRAEIRASLDEARTAFDELLESLSDSDLGRKASNSGWSVGEVVTHVVLSIERTPALIGALRRDDDYLNYPLPIVERVKRVSTWWAARGAMREALGRRFHSAYQLLPALVDTILEDEWGRGGGAYGEGYWTVERALRHQREHVDEHIQQIRQLLGRG